MVRIQVSGLPDAHGAFRFHPWKNASPNLFSEENEFELERAARLACRTRRGDMETIYQRPRDYALEHEGDDEDVV